MKKVCYKCNIEKPILEFYTTKVNSDGYFNKCKSCTNKDSSEWSKNNPKRVKEHDKKQREKRREQRKQEFSSWYQQNKEKRLARVRENRKKPEYAAVVNYHCAMRKVRIKQATPQWLSDEQKNQIKLLYKAASFSTHSTGIPYDVDHIIPLRGKDVSGLNVPWNLQVIERVKNMKKGNRI